MEEKLNKISQHLNPTSFTYTSQAHCPDETARKKGIVVEVGSPTDLSVIAGEMKVSKKVGKNVRLYAMTNSFPDRYIN